MENKTHGPEEWVRLRKALDEFESKHPEATAEGVSLYMSEKYESNEQQKQRKRGRA